MDPRAIRKAASEAHSIEIDQAPIQAVGRSLQQDVARLQVSVDAAASMQVDRESRQRSQDFPFVGPIGWTVISRLETPQILQDDRGRDWNPEAPALDERKWSRAADSPSQQAVPPEPCTARR